MWTGQRLGKELVCKQSKKWLANSFRVDTGQWNSKSIFCRSQWRKWSPVCKEASSAYEIFMKTSGTYIWEQNLLTQYFKDSLGLQWWQGRYLWMFLNVFACFLSGFLRQLNFAKDPWEIKIITSMHKSILSWWPLPHFSYTFLVPGMEPPNTCSSSTDIFEAILHVYWRTSPLLISSVGQALGQ